MATIWIMHKRDHGNYTSKSGIAHIFLPKSKNWYFSKWRCCPSWIYASTRPQNYTLKSGITYLFRKKWRNDIFQNGDGGHFGFMHQRDLKINLICQKWVYRINYTLRSGITHLFRTNSKKIEISIKKAIFSKRPQNKKIASKMSFPC